jgi:hypothetical protein
VLQAGSAAALQCIAALMRVDSAALMRAASAALLQAASAALLQAGVAALRLADGAAVLQCRSWCTAAGSLLQVGSAALL